MTDLIVEDTYRDSLSLAKATDNPLIAIWATNNEHITFHFTEAQARDLITKIEEVIMEIANE